MRTWVLALPALLTACITPPSPVERLNYAAYEMNTATRFGRMDIAAAHVRGSLVGDFMQRHADWGRGTRIVDVELEGLRLITPETAEVRLAVSWHRPSETTMRTSLLAQKWTRHDGDWRLSEELQVGGSKGIFPAASDEAKPAAPAALGQQLTTDRWQ